ncbi:Cwf15/Cwc15 cell cycle control protein [Ophiocordyceps camponoti-floridani]|uniref:Cwf15/Cwc15 cell cycle control protein n=1 Tax=Ophiocordyceps camponoti-floridani TaxID=2030778 RepID=A0A8H4VF54_9HYPO|nr:Cwf15/Cwc15 cell cycle control protein [Ophiocordyceps camponoti-floridani]
MTTAHRPTFDPARGKEALRGPAYHQRLLPAHKQLKYRQAGQGGDADAHEGAAQRDLAAELLAAEEAARAKRSGQAKKLDAAFEDGGSGVGDEDEGSLRRRRVLLETRDVDADEESGADEDDDDEDDDDDDDDDEEDDEDAELQRELERVRHERQEKKQREEKAQAEAEAQQRQRSIALGNPLLNKQDFSAAGRRRWDEDVVFKNQARGTEDKGKKKEFVNDLLRSDFHRRFMSKYVR